MRRFFSTHQPDIGAKAILTGADADHIRKVLRMHPGDTIYLFDGAGSDYRACIDSIAPGRVAVSVLERVASKTESPVRIVLAQAMLKDRKVDEIIRYATELGIAVIMPFMAGRSVSRPDSLRLSSRRKRWEKIAAEAVKQCGRGRIPEIQPADSLEDVLIRTGWCNLKILFWEAESEPFGGHRRPDNTEPRSIAVALGPEGGFTDQEIRQAKSHGYTTASLGPRILKADTASIAACAVLQYVLGDMGRFVR